MLSVPQSGDAASRETGSASLGVHSKDNSAGPRSTASRDDSSRRTSSRDQSRDQSHAVRFADVPENKALGTRESRLSVGTLRATVKFLGRVPRKSRKAKSKPKPTPPEGFVAWKVEAWIRDLLQEAFENYTYVPASAGEEAKRASAMILDAAKTRRLGRYKFVCYVTLGDDSNQGLEVATRCLWDSQNDDYACATHVTESFYVVAILHAIFFE